MKQTVAPKNGVGFELSMGEVLEVTDPNGQQVAEMFCFSVHDPTDILSSGQSIAAEGRVAFTTGATLYSQAGKPMMKILADTCGRHDFLLPPCTQEMLQKNRHVQSHLHTCLENLNFAFTPFPVYRDKISTTFNIFMDVRLDQDGHIAIRRSLSKPGDSIRFLALADMYVALTVCTNEMVNNGTSMPINYEVQTRSALLEAETV